MTGLPDDQAPPTRAAERRTRQMSFRAPDDLRLQLHRFALDHDRSAQDVIIDALRRYLANPPSSEDR